MIQCRGGTGFPLEPFQRRMILGVIVRQKLESNRSAEAGVLGFVHDTHTTAPEFFHDAVVGDGLPDHDSSRQLGDGPWREFYLTASTLCLSQGDQTTSLCHEGRTE